MVVSQELLLEVLVELKHLLVLVQVLVHLDKVVIELLVTEVVVAVASLEAELLLLMLPEVVVLVILDHLI